MEEHGTTFFFPPYRLQPDERRLSRNGEVVPLTPKEFDTLLVLVEAGGRVVGKEELIGRVWPDSYVGDGSLARNISVLRKALGEEVIETLPKKGYRINVPISSAEVVGAPATDEAESKPAQELAPAKTGEPKDQRAAHWWRRGAVAGPAAACAVILVLAFRLVGSNSVKPRSTAANAVGVRSILIQKDGGLDPLAEGFKLAKVDEDYTHVLWNLEHTGFDRWRLVTHDQNFYYRKLTDAEKEFALERDWKLTCVCALEKGAGESDVDLGPASSRFDIDYFHEGNKYFVGLINQISPQITFDPKIEFAGVADVNHPHTYELRFDHTTQTASLWIDGQQRSTGYRGHHQYQENYGLMFGAAIYRTAKESSMVFRSVRFEAD